MPTLFDFTYNLNAEDAQDAVFAAIADAAKKEYEPSTHFFTEQNLLSAIVAANYATDAFGPVTGSLTTKYRTTSVVRTASANPVKLFAICDGQILIQPQTGDATKVNLILKPTASFAPLKIKYFIYRGVNKADWIDASGNLPAVNAADPNQPALLKSVWAKFLAFNLPLFNLGLIPTPPNVFPAKLLGYDETDAPSNLIEHYFTRKINSTFFQIPICKKGEYIGNFSGQIGLDIVLDHGDYELVNQDELFKLNLGFARLKANVLDTATIPASTTVKVKRYKEYIYQFIDPAAFWGSHIKCGKIILFDNAAGITTNNDIYTRLISKYQTRNKIYLYIQGEKNRSYNYFETTRKVYGFVTAGKLNDTNGWPISIEEITLTAATTTFKSIKKLQLDYSVSSSINELDRHVSIDFIAPNNKTNTYPLLYKPPTPASPPATLTGKTPAASIQFPVNGLKSCAVFIFIYANLKQEFPMKDYFNELWPVNLASNLYLPPGELNLTHWCTYDKSRMVSLDPALNVGASIQNKIVFDNGINQVTGAPPVPTKKRRLYMAVLKKNTIHDAEYDNLNIDTITSGLAEKTNSNEEYALNLYGDLEFSVYKGTFTDGAATVNSLTLFHNTSLPKKCSYFQLGITEEEYNKLVYDNINVPAIVPPAIAPAQILPLDADNVFFNLVEDTSFVNADIRKFKVGLRYEDNTGALVTITPTSPANDVFVYTVDGKYFFSKDYSQFQGFYKVFAKAKVEFRTVPVAIPASGGSPAIPVYNGEFGFDWLRIADNNEPSYQSTVRSGYERPNGADLNTEYEGAAEAFKALKREYYSLPTQKNNDYYSIPYLNLFSKTFSNTVASVPAPPFEANLRILVEIDENLDKLAFDYDPLLFTIDKPVLADKLIRAKSEGTDKTIKITCLKDFSEPQQIRLLAYPVGVTDKKLAKLAGIILLNKNDSLSRKVANIVLVSVRTDVNNDGTPEIAQFMAGEVLNLYNILHQDLTSCNLVNTGLSMNLTAVADFKQKFTAGVPIASGFINSNGGILQNNTVTGVKIHKYLRDRFTASNAIYAKYFQVFAFDGIFQRSTVLGHVDSIGKPTVVLYNPNANSAVPRDLTTLNHETMHGLGLYHTHSEINTTPAGVFMSFITIVESQKKFVFPHAFNPPLANPLNATDNVMSYLANAIVLWNWQRAFIKMK